MARGIDRGVTVFLASAVLSTGAVGQFSEPEVRIIHTFVGEAQGDALGWAVSGLADVDGDGVQDLINPAPGNDANGNASGRVYVLSGASGKALPGRTLTGPFAGAQLGYAIADAGDVDGDGTHDIIAGSPTPNNTPGRVFIYSGADGALIRMVEGEANGSAFGAAVGSPGDLDGDGLSEVIVGAPGFGAGAGRAYVISGKDGSTVSFMDGEAAGDGLGSGIAGAGDIDGDGKGDWIVGAPRAGLQNKGLAYVIGGAGGLIVPPLAPDPTGASFGQFFVAGCGDVNADGTIDLYVGDYADSQAYVYSGKDGDRLLTLVFPSGFGCGRGAGDVDGDGHDDLVVGAYAGRGKVYVISGADGSVLRTITSTTNNENFGYDAVGVGDVDGDGWIDFFVGAAGGGGNRSYVIAGNPPACWADCEPAGGGGVLDLFDFLCFVNRFNNGDPRADCDGVGGLDLFDFLCFVNAFAAGCP